MLSHKFYEKKISMQNLTFCVYNVVQDELFTQKVQKSQKSVLFLKTRLLSFVSFAKIKLNLKKKQAFFLNH